MPRYADLPFFLAIAGLTAIITGKYLLRRWL